MRVGMVEFHEISVDSDTSSQLSSIQVKSSAFLLF